MLDCFQIIPRHFPRQRNRSWPGPTTALSTTPSAPRWSTATSASSSWGRSLKESPVSPWKYMRNSWCMRWECPTPPICPIWRKNCLEFHPPNTAVLITLCSLQKDLNQRPSSWSHCLSLRRSCRPCWILLCCWGSLNLHADPPQQGSA